MISQAVDMIQCHQDYPSVMKASNYSMSSRSQAGTRGLEDDPEPERLKKPPTSSFARDVHALTDIWGGRFRASIEVFANLFFVNLRARILIF